MQDSNSTSNHKYNVPTKGTKDWHVPLNDNFDSLDTGVEIRDKDDARSNYKPKKGAKFLATDTEAEYIGDGSQWNKLASSGKHPSFESLSLSGSKFTYERKVLDETKIKGSEENKFKYNGDSLPDWQAYQITYYINDNSGWEKDLVFNGMVVAEAAEDLSGLHQHLTRRKPSLKLESQYKLTVGAKIQVVGLRLE